MAEKLTGKQWAFVLAYTGQARFNATEAARQAGYKGNDVTLATVGYENLRKPHIKRAIEARMKSLVMSADEALLRLSDHAKSDMIDFISLDANDLPTLDIKKAIGAGKTHLIKKLHYNNHGPVIELYDSQAALIQIIRQERGDKLALALDEETLRLAEKMGVTVDGILEKLTVMIRKQAEAKGLA